MVVRVLIVGGGIAGLATALVLRRAGHQVQVFEASQLTPRDVIGPIVHLGPKSCELLRQWGADAAIARGVLIKEAPEFLQDGTLQDKEGASQPPGWEYYERGRIHEALRNAAISPDGAGKPVEILLGKKVISVNPDTASIRIDGGQVTQGDLIVGADGFHSTVRQSISKHDSVTNAPSKIAVHFSVSSSQHNNSPVVQRFRGQPERYEKWLGNNVQLNVYAVEPGTLLFDSNLPVEGQAGRIKKEILKAFEPANQDFKQLLTAVDENDIHFWTQQSLPNVDQWTSKRVVLVGDAAHPFLPYELPGTSQTLNDALALGTELHSGIEVGEIDQALAAWEGPRKERVQTIQKKERSSWYST